MVGGPGITHFISKQHALNEKLHTEYAKAMARPGDPITTNEKPYPEFCTLEEGGKWKTPCAVKFSDGSIYDLVSKKWRPGFVDLIDQWERSKAGDPLARSEMLQAGDHLVREVKKLRAQLLDLEQERRDEHNAKVIKRRFSDSDENGDF
jgi:hypothetical protein